MRHVIVFGQPFDTDRMSIHGPFATLADATTWVETQVDNPGVWQAVELYEPDYPYQEAPSTSTS